MMPVTENFAPETFGAPKPNSAYVGVPDGTTARGEKRIASGIVANAADDLTTSKYRLAQIPSTAILHPDTQIDLQSFGAATVSVGVDNSDASLIADTTVSSLSAPSTPITKFGAKWNKPLWEQLGMSEDPKTAITLTAFAKANASAAGTISFEIVWLQG